MNIIQAKNFLETHRRAMHAARILARDLDYIMPRDPRACVEQVWGPIVPDRFDSPAYRDLVAKCLGQAMREGRIP